MLSFPQWPTLYLLLVLGSAARAEVVEVPLRIEFRYLESLVAQALEMNAEGHSTLRRDSCNSVALSDLAVSGGEDALEVSMAVTADAGTGAFGGCVGPSAWDGLMRVRLAAVSTAGGLAVSLQPIGAELRRPDGTSDMLTRAATVLAENVVLPRLETVRVDLHQPLAEIDGVIEELLPNPESLTERARLTAVSVNHQAMHLTIGFETSPPAVPDTAATEPPLTEGELAQWQRLEDELDGFLTAVITALAAQSDDPDLRFDLLGAMLDARLAIAVALAAPDQTSGDPVRRLFLSTWDRLRPHAAALAQSRTLEHGESLRLAAFISGADAIQALDRLGDDYGVEISRHGLRRLARMLLAEKAPASFTPLPLTIDHELRDLLGLRAPARDGSIVHSAPLRWLGRLLPAAHADTIDPAEALRGLSPTQPGLEAYLALVDRLLVEEVARYLEEDDRIPAEYEPLIEPLVRATAWKESCWRHYLGDGDPPEVIRSPIGSVGIMQINQRVWRGVYDIDRLAGEIRYNAAAGIEILAQYLTHYAIRHGEHQQPGGIDNLVRATYAAYNGGPGQLARYRKEETATSLKAIDAAFWNYYQQVRDSRWPAISSCYS